MARSFSKIAIASTLFCFSAATIAQAEYDASAMPTPPPAPPSSANAAASAAPAEAQPEATASPLKRLRAQMSRRSGEQAPDHLRSRIADHAAKHGVPASLAEAIIRVESRFNPRASNAGNYGLMQIRHQTARGVGYTGSAAGLLDAETNLRYGMAYLAVAYRAAGGDTCGTVMRYQSGLAATRMNGANRAYCAKVRNYVVARG